MGKTIVSDLIKQVQTADGGVAMTIGEYAENQYGMHLPHYSQQFLFGSTGLRFGVVHSISGMQQSCKSPFLMDLMKTMVLPPEENGSGGIAYYYDLEDKCSPTLLKSMFADHPEMVVSAQSPFQMVRKVTINKAEAHVFKKLLPQYCKAVPDMDVPIMIGWDSIGGAAAEDTVSKIQSDGEAGKGFYDKAHLMKYLCENWGALIGNIPLVFIVINQEKESAAATPGSYAPQKHLTGGTSQLYKAGHMISVSYKNQPLKDGKIITMRTDKTSFCDFRKLIVRFVWNQFGDRVTDSQGHRWLWAEASARCLATPEVVGELRDIIDVKLSDQGLVTCPTFGLKSVQPEEFETALFSEENKEVLNELYNYQKIEKLKTVDEYKEYVEKSKDRAKLLKEAEKQAKIELQDVKKKLELEKAKAKQDRKEAKVKKASPKPVKAAVDAVDAVETGKVDEPEEASILEEANNG